jgi:hypothetical protein
MEMRCVDSAPSPRWVVYCHRAAYVNISTIVCKAS